MNSLAIDCVVKMEPVRRSKNNKTRLLCCGLVYPFKAVMDREEELRRMQESISDFEERFRKIVISRAKVRKN